jgi:superfamily II DNA or RNA helicase
MGNSNSGLIIYDNQQLVKSITTIANVCNGASSSDGVGFSRSDAQLGLQIALLNSSHWTQAITYEAWLLLAKYQNQLAKFGIDYDEIKAPPRTHYSASKDLALIYESRKKLNKNAVYTNDSAYIIEAEYNEQLNEILKTIEGIQWISSNNVWVAPMEAVEQVASLVNNYGFKAADGLADVFGQYHTRLENGLGSITLSKTNKLIFNFPFNAQIVNLVKSIPNRMWDVKKKVWITPISIVAIEIADKFNLEMSDDLRKIILEQTKTETELLEKSTSADADIDVPTLKGTLMPYQKAAVSYASQVSRCLIADQMGLGKTVEALAIAEYKNAFPLVIICPASLKENWKREANKWMPHRTVNVVSGKSDITSSDINVVNYDILYKFTEAITHLSPNGLIFDESHYVKNSASKRAKSAKEIAKAVPRSGTVLLLSGTPVTNRPEELVSQLEIMGTIGAFGGKWAFLKRYTAAYHNGFGWDTKGASNLSELNTKLRQTCYIRRTKDEVLKELPPKLRSVIHVEPSGLGYKEYKKAEVDLVSFLAEHGYRKSDSAEHLRRTGILKRLAGEAKFESVTEWIDSFLESCDRKLIVFAHHVLLVDKLAEKYGGLRISGRDSLESRQNAVDTFQNDPKARVIVLNLQAGGVGLTLTAASDVCFVEQGWTPGEHDQAEDRCHRIGQKNNVQAWYLLGANTIDEDIYDLVEAKRLVVDAVTEGDDVENKSIIGDLMKRILDKQNKPRP